MPPNKSFQISKKMRVASLRCLIIHNVTESLGYEPGIRVGILFLRLFFFNKNSPVCQGFQKVSEMILFHLVTHCRNLEIIVIKIFDPRMRNFNFKVGLTF